MIASGALCARPQGSATILLSGVVAVAALCALAVARAGAAAVATARAETAADAAALAAAADLAQGRSAALAQRTAAETASRNSARLIRCSCGGGQATVTVAVALPRLPSFGWEARATARAELHPECPG